MAAHVRVLLKGAASVSVILSALWLPWAGQAIDNASREKGAGHVAVIQPTAPLPPPAGESASLIPRTYIPIAKNLSINDSDVLLSDKPGFDKCNPPSVEHMQVWWDRSPYWSVNIYMGGISLACTPYNLTPTWMHAVAAQGWTFIPTWVGLQAPCSRFRYRMSADPAVSYLQGKAEAGEAVAAARNLGLMGDQVIYADIESYYGASTSCKAAVASYLQGWVDGLHATQAKAGAYGAACTSYVTEWAALLRPPDYVWLAHWYRDVYDPFASVWNTPCLSNGLWANRQRIKQYTGPHVETWGDRSATLDSNALDGAINAHVGSQGESLDPESSAVSHLRTAGLLSSSQGWALLGDQLFWTEDSGSSWREITPQEGQQAPVLSAEFIDPRHGMLVRMVSSGPSADELLVQTTADGGRSWQSFPLQVEVGPGGSPVSQAFVEFVDKETGWLALRLQSGSSFSLGRLFATRDGGRTWQERSLPLGGPVRFLDAQHGWTAGGPSGDQLFYTEDGGITWLPGTPQLPAGAPRQVYYGLPDFHSDGTVVLPVTFGSIDPQLVLYAASQPGEEWVPDQVIDLTGLPEAGAPLPFSLNPQGSWWAVAPGTGRLYTVSNHGQSEAVSAVSGLPQGVVALDFASQQSGWAIVQEGNCVGQKSESGAGSFRCSSQTRLVGTTDGGRSWQEITPAP